MPVIHSVEGMRRLGARIGSQLQTGDVVVLSGPLGAGKTTLVQGLAQALGVQDAVTSPTFVIAREHRTPAGSFQHVDAYRLANAAAFWDLDIDLQDSITVVEWGDVLLAELVDDPVLVVRIEPDIQSGERRVTIDGTEQRWPPPVLAHVASFAEFEPCVEIPADQHHSDRQADERPGGA